MVYKILDVSRRHEPLSIRAVGEVRHHPNPKVEMTNLLKSRSSPKFHILHGTVVVNLVSCGKWIEAIVDLVDDLCTSSIQSW